MAGGKSRTGARAPGSSSINYKVSPDHLLVPTLGELMKARWPGSRNVAVSGKDSAAVMMTGHKADERWYWTGKAFATDLAAAPVPRVVPRVNAAIAAALVQPRPPLQDGIQVHLRQHPALVGHAALGDGLDALGEKIGLTACVGVDHADKVVYTFLV